MGFSKECTFSCDVCGLEKKSPYDKTPDGWIFRDSDDSLYHFIRGLDSSIEYLCSGCETDIDSAIAEKIAEIKKEGRNEMDRKRREFLAKVGQKHEKP